MGFYLQWHGLTLTGNGFTTVSFPLKPGVDVICGRNGSGKTTFLEALRAVLGPGRQGGLLHGMVEDLGPDVCTENRHWSLMAAVAAQRTSEEGHLCRAPGEFAEVVSLLGIDGLKPLVVLAQHALYAGVYPGGRREQPVQRTVPESHEPLQHSEIRMLTPEEAEIFYGHGVRLIRDDLFHAADWVQPPATGFGFDSSTVETMAKVLEPLHDANQYLTLLWRDDESFDRWMTAVTPLANDINQILFDRAMYYRVHRSTTAELVKGHPLFTWQATLHADNLDVVQPNATHNYFWRVALAVADYLLARTADSDDDGLDPAVLMLDEPERGLHPTAVTHLAVGLRKVSDRGLQIVVATHSPVLVASQTARLWLTKRHHEQISVELVTSKVAQSAQEELGLNRGDLLMMTKTFLVVEGQHDKVILETLFGTEHGPDYLRADYLRYTDANMVFVMDNLTSRVRDLWNDARTTISNTAIARDEISDELRTALVAMGKDSNKDRTAEFTLMAQLMSAAIEHRLEDRVEVYPLMRADILDYLSPHALLGVELTWDELQKRAGSAGSGTKFKKWLEKQYGEEVLNDKNIAAAAQQLDQPSPELTDILAFIGSISQD
jgi:predicted ATPase